MREQLLAYLLDALDPDERRRVEDELRGNRSMQRELEQLRESLDPRCSQPQQFEPPAGLADKTCRRIALQAAEREVTRLSPVRTRRWTLTDLTVATAVVLVAAMVLFPTFLQSRADARLSTCQDNFRTLGVALGKYSELNGGYFPYVATGGNLATAGVYAVRLHQSGLLPRQSTLLCPESNVTAGEAIHIPTPTELREARGSQLAKLQRTMGGSYTYTLGYMDRGIYHGTRNLGRVRFAIMSDFPSTSLDRNADNIHGTLINVLFEDGHVQTLDRCDVLGCRNDIYKNDQGLVAAGIHADDAVNGHSAAGPILPVAAPAE